MIFCCIPSKRQSRLREREAEKRGRSGEGDQGRKDNRTRGNGRNDSRPSGCHPLFI
ncbi:MAG: hypothetical protein WCY49_06240 [Anaerovoracaceae bacterium]